MQYLLRSGTLKSVKRVPDPNALCYSIRGARVCVNERLLVNSKAQASVFNGEHIEGLPNVHSTRSRRRRTRPWSASRTVTACSRIQEQ
jgi:hypothetical protein